MKRTIIYLKKDLNPVNFETIDYKELVENGYIKGVNTLFENKVGYEEDRAIKSFTKVCETVNTELIVVYKEEYEDKIIIQGFSK